MLPRVGTYTLFSLNLESPSQAKKIFPIKKKKEKNIRREWSNGQTAHEFTWIRRCTRET